MAKVTYILTAGSDLVKADVNSEGNVELTFQTEAYHSSDFDTAEASGDRQGDMLWELFDHQFEVHDEDGTLIEYDESGNRK